MNVCPGDHAYIVKARFPENIGLPVEVIEWHGRWNMWLCKACNPRRVVVTQGEYVGRIANLPIFHIPDSNLRKIAGPSVNIDEAVEKEIPA